MSDGPNGQPIWLEDGQGRRYLNTEAFSPWNDRVADWVCEEIAREAKSAVWWSRWIAEQGEGDVALARMRWYSCHP